MRFLRRILAQWRAWREHRRATPLQRALRSRGYGSQTVIARDLKMGESQISRYARGVLVPGIRGQQRIAEWLGMDREELWP